MENKGNNGASLTGPGSHERSPDGLRPSGFDPSREDNQIVGHKTWADGSHTPLRKAEAEAMWAAAEAAREKRATDMPTERDAILALNQAYQRLTELGWNNPIYCPKDGTSFDVIEAGSTGIHSAHYSGEWPDGSWWIEGDGDLWPSRPTLYRPTEAEIAKRAALREAFDRTLVNQAPAGLGPPGFDPSRERGGEFAGKPTAALAAQCRMQARGNLDPEYCRFMFAVADRLQGFAASKSQGAPSTDWQLAYAIEWANRSVDSVKERMWAVEDGLRALVDYLANTPHHNAPEAAAARKLLRSEGWTDAGHEWLDAGAPLAPAEGITQTPDPSAHNRTEAVREEG